MSSQVVRSVLGGKATGTYLGRVVVARGAIGTDGEQSIRAMLLDRTATANGSVAGTTQGQFFGANAATLAGIATFAGNSQYDTAFGGSKN